MTNWRSGPDASGDLVNQRQMGSLMEDLFRALKNAASHHNFSINGVFSQCPRA
jgi:hypothetical protein